MLSRTAQCVCRQINSSVSVGLRVQCVNYVDQYSTSGFYRKDYSHNSKQQSRGSNDHAWKLALLSAGAATLGALVFNSISGCKAAEQIDGSDVRSQQPGESIDGLPYYCEEDLRQHKTKDAGIWVTFKNGVYDVTEFVEGHPGGERILLAAGGSVEPYWGMYATHHKENVYNILEDMRIGNYKISKEMLGNNFADPYASDPKRHPALRINSVKPFDADTPVDLILDNFVTPNELFFVRNHLPVPDVDIEKYRLHVEIEGGKKFSFTFEELKRNFKEHTVMSTLQCTGNRRDEMSAYKEIRGTGSGISQISNAVWKGVRLRDLLTFAGVEEDHPDIEHVQFEGLDKDITGDAYGASIPIEKAMNSYGDVILAYEMNGKELPRDHGYPIRVIVPGVVGARNVKWVSRVYASKDESPSHWQQNDYKSFSPSVGWHDVDFTKAPAIQDAPVQSVIIHPKDGTTVDQDDEEVHVRGYAWSGAGQGIVRVDVSIDGGHTWKVAHLTKPKQRLGRTWAWTFWDVVVPIPENHSGKLHIICKAVDTAHNTQPDSLKAIWNLKGVLNNCWHRVNVEVL